MDIGVYGVGRFGAFWASLLTAFGRVYGYTRNPERVFPENVQKAAEDRVLTCDVLFFCVSISSFEEVIKRVAARIGPETLVIDTCSVKVHPVRVMKENLSPSQEIVATHPMFGPDSAAGGVEDLPIVYYPVRVSEERAEQWRQNFRRIGLRAIKMAPDTHDREAAFTQGITHFIGRVLNDLALSESPISTMGYQKLLEIIEQTCNDPYQLFLDLQCFNPHTHEMRTKLQHSLQKVLDDLG